ncbi:hypothetical protein FB45DRAFT_945835 [Roridomyces roridus]|uniref:Transmembrane protein n=1 Tax=Roridomyces roridus TaxID=1738132 RepID=A0AAD7FBC0_9AGAR|nr:hypothetical protein FB45DRAFT_945835 [Roridomyces roridus]
MQSVRVFHSFSWCFSIHLLCQFGAASSYVIPHGSRSFRKRDIVIDQVDGSRTSFNISNNPAVLVGPIVAVLVLCGVVIWLIKRNSSPPPAPLPLPEASTEKPHPLPMQYEPSIPAARSSWEGYVEVPLALNHGQSGAGAGATLQPSFSVSTRKLYISNQIKRARQKERELERVSVSFPSVRTASTSRGAAASPSSEDGESATSKSDRTVRQSRQSFTAETETETDADTVRHSPSRESLQERLYGARDEIEMLNSRIRELEGGAVRGPRSPGIVEVRR